MILLVALVALRVMLGAVAPWSRRDQRSRERHHHAIETLERIANEQARQNGIRVATSVAPADGASVGQGDGRPVAAVGPLPSARPAIDGQAGAPDEQQPAVNHNGQPAPATPNGRPAPAIPGERRAPADPNALDEVRSARSPAEPRHGVRTFRASERRPDEPTMVLSTPIPPPRVRVPAPLRFDDVADHPTVEDLEQEPAPPLIVAASPVAPPLTGPPLDHGGRGPSGAVPNGAVPNGAVPNGVVAAAARWGQRTTQWTRRAGRSTLARTRQAPGLAGRALGAERPVPPTASPVEPVPNRRGVRVVLAAAAVALVAALVGLVISDQSGSNHAARPSAQALAAASRPAITTPATTVPPTPSTTVAPAISGPVESSSEGQTLWSYQLTTSAPITLHTAGPCWIEVRQTNSTGTALVSTTLAAGASQTVDGPAWIRLGNPRAVTVTVDGISVSLPASDGSPEDLEFQ